MLWTKAADKRLIQLYERGLVWGAIAKQLSAEFESTVSVKAVDSRLFVLKEMGSLGSWLDTAAIGFLDIETSNFDANAGFMISWAMLVPKTQTLSKDLITSKEITKGFGDDSRIVGSLVEALKTVDVVSTFWGTGFDVPFVRARAMWHKAPFPAYGSISHLDLFYASRRLLKMSRRSLHVVTAFLGIEGKTHLDLSVWNKARVGHGPSLSYVMDHNVADVEILALLFDRVRPYAKWIRKSI